MTTTTISAAPTGVRSDTARRIRVTITAVVAYAVLIVGALAMIMPFIFSLANSFKTLPDITNNPMLLYPTQGLSFSGYQKILSGDFARWIFNSAFVAIAVTLGHLVFDSMAGYALARIRFPGRNLLFAGVVGTMMVPGIVLLIPRYLVYVQLGMVDQYSGLIIPTLADAFGIFLMKQFFESIPIDIEEAAAIDGAGRYRMFFTVILPMAVPALTTLAIFAFQGAWNDFTGPLIVINNNQSLFTLPLGLANLKGTGTGQTVPWDILLSGSLITTLPMAIIFFVFQRYFMESANYTGVKG
jgi:multiple sugar transport system permease protein